MLVFAPVLLVLVLVLATKFETSNKVYWSARRIKSGIGTSDALLYQRDTPPIFLKKMMIKT